MPTTTSANSTTKDTSAKEKRRNNSMSPSEEQELALQLVQVVEQAAIAAARTMGYGDRKGSDRVRRRGHAQSFRKHADRRDDRHRREVRAGPIVHP